MGRQPAAGADPRVSLEVGLQPALFPQRFTGAQGTVTDNLLVGPSDYEKWTINAPLDPRLPDGGGYPITLYTITGGLRAGAQNYITLETDYGPDRNNYWHGVDLTVNARLRNELNLQVGTSTGKAVTDNCATTVLIDSPDPRNCRNEEPFQTTLRGSASYTMPKVDVLIAATVRSQPASRISTAAARTTVAQLARAEHGGAAAARPSAARRAGDRHHDRTAARHRPSALWPRRNQIDMRFAKIVRFRRRARTSAWISATC